MNVNSRMKWFCDFVYFVLVKCIVARMCCYFIGRVGVVVLHVCDDYIFTRRCQTAILVGGAGSAFGC